tara:strand:+ start:28646 stop:28885 length:240 start_codon:yes stop_codon:yes gene_type:complete
MKTFEELCDTYDDCLEVAKKLLPSADVYPHNVIQIPVQQPLLVTFPSSCIPTEAMLNSSVIIYTFWKRYTNFGIVWEKV